MADEGSEQDDISFLRTDDMVCLQHGATNNRVCLAAEGFGNRHCFLENIADKNLPPEISSCVFVIEQALSVRALQEMVTAEQAAAENEGEESKSSAAGGHRTLLYGHAVLLRHGHSNMYLACLSTSSSKDKLSFDVGLRENSQGEACWWTIHPASKQRSEGEKVRVGDDLILVSVATERYLHTALEGEQYIVNASFHQTHWSIAPFGTGTSRAKNVGFVFGGEVLRFFHGGDECLTVPTNWSDTSEQNTVVYEGGAVFNQARSLWRLDLARTKWSGGFIIWGHPLRIHHITTGRYLGINENNEICLLSREEATIERAAFCLKANKEKNKDDKRDIDEKDEEIIGSPLIKFGDTTVYVQHVETGLWLSYKTYETKKRGVGKVEEKQAIMSEEGKMDDGLEFSRSQEEEAKTARVIRKCETQFNSFVQILNSLHSSRTTQRAHRLSRSPSPAPPGAQVPLPTASNPSTPANAPLFSDADQEGMIMCLEDLINYFAQPDEDCDHEERQNRLKALRNRQDLFQEEGILNLILEAVDKMNIITTQGLLTALVGEESSSNWDTITNYLYQLLAAIIKGNHTNCAHFAQSHRLDWLFSSLSSQQASEGTGMLDVLHCVLIDSPEALNMMKENHIKVIISLLEKHGRDPKVLDVLCSLCVGNGVAVRSSQNNICDNLLPSKNLLLQTKLIDRVASMRPNIYVGKVENSAMYRKWYFEVMIDHIEMVSHLEPHFRVGWANTNGYVPYPSGGSKWGGNGVGDDLYSFGFDGTYIWTCGRANLVRNVSSDQWPIVKNNVIGCILDLNIPLITFTVNGIPIRGCFKNFNADGMFYPVISFSAKYSCRFLFGGDHGRLKFGPPQGHSPIIQTLLPLQELNIEPCFQFGDLVKGVIFGPNVELFDDAAFVPKPVDTNEISLPSYIESVRDKLAENTHEVWSMNKIEQSWVYAETRDDIAKTHPCLTSFERLPLNEKKYDTTLALQTLKTIIAIGYRITVDKTPSRIKSIRLPNDPYLQSNGYKPAPMDLSQIELTAKMNTLVDLLAENTHNVWAKERISQGWTYGRLEDHLMRRSPHLVPYKLVDDVIKKANRDTATETVKTLIAYGYNLEPPSGDAAAESANIFGKKDQTKYDFRSYRAEKTYAVTNGKWYYEVEILSEGPIKLGWSRTSFSPHFELGGDENSFAYDCLHAKKCFANSSEAFGKQVQIGDVVGCMLDLNDRIISFSLNGELLLDSVGSEAAFAELTIPTDAGYVPAFTLGVYQKIRLICGQDVNQLKYFTQCGLQEGYQPFCVNMNRNMTFWYNKDEPIFCDVDDNSNIEVTRIPAGSDSSPALKLSHKLFETQEKASWEFVRLSLPVQINDFLIDELERSSRWEEIKRRIQRNRNAGYIHPARLEQHMLKSGFSISDVKELNRAYSDTGETDEAIDSMNQQQQQQQQQQQATSWMKRKQSALVKTKSFENELKVPTVQEAQAMMAMTSPKTRSTSVEALNRAAKSQQQHLDGVTDPKIRSKSPFRFLRSKKDEKAEQEKQRKRQVGRAQEIGTGLLQAPPIDVSNASFRGLQPPFPTSTIGRRRSTIAAAAGSGGRRGSRVKMETETLPDETNDLLDETVLDLVDEYFYGLRIFPGQDPNHVYVGWVTPNFKHFDKTFDSAMIKKVTLQVWSETGQLSDYFDRQNCYMLNAGKMYAEVHEDEAQQGSRSNQGMFIGCHVDTASGVITFMADGKSIKHKFRIEPGIKLFPAIIFEATSKECLQFELGRTPTTLPLSSAILKTSRKHLTPQCPPRLRVQYLQAYQWSRVPNQSLRPHSLKLSDIRGWSMLCEDPVSQLVIHVPEEDRCIDILELIENEKFLQFHSHTLALYGALCFQGNNRAAHIICDHVDEKQLLYAIQSEYMSGPLRTGFADLLIDLHLEIHANARNLTQNEFILPVNDGLRRLYLDERMIHSISSLNCVSIRPKMTMNERNEKNYSIRDMASPFFPVNVLKQFVMEALDDAVKKGNRPNRDPIGGSNENLFVPLIKLADKLLLIGCIDDMDLERILILIDPETFDPDYDFNANPRMKGLIQMSLDEGVQLQMTYILHHLMDLQLRHRVEAIVAFSSSYVKDLQTDQLRRYIEIKQEDMPAAVAAKKTREFRCTPQEQMRTILSFKNQDEENQELCPTRDELKEFLNNFHEKIMHKINVVRHEDDSDSDSGIGDVGSSRSWSSKLFNLVNNVKSFGQKLEMFVEKAKEPPEDVLVKKIVTTIISWAEETELERNELIRQMFYLLLRCYNGIGTLMEALSNTYVMSDQSKSDVEDLLQHLNIVRALLPVQMGPEEEEVMRQALWTMVNNRIFFQHPDLIRILRVHENVMDVMMNTLKKQKSDDQTSKSSDSISEMVVACCRFLCFFCRSGKKNQKAMFDHLDFLLEHSNILLSRPSLRGTTPLDVAYSSLMENPELALALRENYLEKIAIYLSRCGLQSNQELIDKGYPDVGWDPVEGERYLDFLRFCVWVNGESVEENANLVIRLLIRRPECLGPALRGEGQGLMAAIKEAIVMSERISKERQHQQQMSMPGKEIEEDEDYIDMGSAILNFYCTLVDVLGRCAPEAATIAQGKNECLRTRAILRSLVPIEDLEGVLSLRFTLTNNSEGKSDMPNSLLPSHKQSIVLFLERVYGIDTQEAFFRLLEEAFLPDLRAATMFETGDSSGSDSEMSLALNRYLGNAVLPLLIKYHYYFADADNWSNLLDASLHTVYRLAKVKILTKGQREIVSDFLVALTKEMMPSMLLRLLRKLCVDVSTISESTTVAYRLLTLHYERCARYYGAGGQGTYGTASEEERRLTMVLFSNIFDSLAKMEYDPDLFGQALPCLTAIASALPPDYSMPTNASEDASFKTARAEFPYIPEPVDISHVNPPPDLMNLVQKFSEHYHDAWACRKFDHGWQFGEQWAYKKTHPRLKPYHMLNEREKELYREPIRDALKTLMALGYTIDRSDSGSGTLSKPPVRHETQAMHATSIQDYNPQPVDMTNLTLNREMQTMAERLAENAHDIWAKSVREQSRMMGGGIIHPQMVPYDLLTDREKKKNRERSQELLKFLQFEGYKVFKSMERNRMNSMTAAETPTIAIQPNECRFASSLLEKLLQYMDTASISLRLLKPSANFSRRSSFKQSSRDVKFFSKVVLPLTEKYFSAQRMFFLNSITSGNVQTAAAGVATVREKELVASLFCKLAAFVRSKLPVIGSDVKTCVRCLQVLIQATDARTIVKYSPDFVKTSMQTFFNHAADDLANCVINLQQAKFPYIRGTAMKTSSSLNSIQLMLLPVLTSLFDHLAVNEFGSDLLVNDIQVACYKMLNSFVHSWHTS
ncbi:Ryanodine receptor 2 [Dermatophagoides farinae]|uniref:Ryanodine receptor 2 n=1 Tax=Dermatophagoides farinae TaxID=6954 RepID=A0A922HHF9_DERFA|nr:Ryanodine receptor 2 [Dermatophagoides farinae]